MLSPEVTEGPYYVAGEYIRSNVTEDQAGVALHLEVQVLDIDTCEPVTGAYAEIWREYLYPSLARSALPHSFQGWGGAIYQSRDLCI